MYRYLMGLTRGIVLFSYVDSTILSCCKSLNLEMRQSPFTHLLRMTLSSSQAAVVGTYLGNEEEIRHVAQCSFVKEGETSSFSPNSKYHGVLKDF
jgi:hypothetical protein